MPDVPVNAIFLILFLMVGGAHGFLYVKNRSQGRMFIINALVTGKLGEEIPCFVQKVPV